MSKDVKRTVGHWARLSVGYYRDPKLIEVGVLGEAAFLRLLALARENVERVDQSGTVSVISAKRELREVTELYSALNPDKGFTELLASLEGVGLIRREGTNIIVARYQEWQTTREEIEAVRESTRRRVAESRARRQAARDAAKEDDEDNDNPGGEDQMGVYDQSVEAFADLRDIGEVKSGRTKVGKYGLNPAQVADAEKIVEHLSKVRKDTLGGSFRVTATWWTDVRKLLNSSADGDGFTADQVCDLIDFALHHKFWHTHTQTPAGLAKHGRKLYTSDEFIAWSKKNGRPEANRPRNTLIGDSGPASFRGELVADKATDWSKVSEDL